MRPLVTQSILTRHPSGATDRTGTLDERTILSVTLPNAQREGPERPWVLMIIRSIPFLAAYSRIVSAGFPSIITGFAVTPLSAKCFITPTRYSLIKTLRRRLRHKKQIYIRDITSMGDVDYVGEYAFGSLRSIQRHQYFSVHADLLKTSFLRWRTQPGTSAACLWKSQRESA